MRRSTAKTMRNHGKDSKAAAPIINVALPRFSCCKCVNAMKRIAIHAIKAKNAVGNNNFVTTPFNPDLVFMTFVPAVDRQALLCPIQEWHCCPVHCINACIRRYSHPWLVVVASLKYMLQSRSGSYRAKQKKPAIEAGFREA